jgi:hypothetical protein
MPPAGLEPAALCLASSIRLSLTARQSWGCWLDYILDVAVPTRIVSEEPARRQTAIGFLRITQSSRFVTWTTDDRSTRGSQGVPAYRVVHSMGSRSLPHQGSNKADALSTELQGLISTGWHVNTSKSDVNRTLFALTAKKRDRPGRAISLVKDYS